MKIAVGAFVIVTTFLAYRRMLAPIRGTVTSPFGPRVRNGVAQWHNGTDIAADIGSDVCAPSDGILLPQSYHPDGGTEVYMRLDNGFTLGLSHLLRSNSVGEAFVRRGAVIALTGNSGNATGPSVHLTLRDRDGKYLDPEKYFDFDA